jgi:hypothetical protein
MVNIRATLRRATNEGVIGPATQTALVRIAKTLYYPMRSYARLLDLATAEDLPDNERAMLTSWLPSGRIDCKRDDAISLLETIANTLKTPLMPFRAGYHFEYTDAWEQVAQRLGHQQAAALREDLPPEALLDELRLDSGAYGRVMSKALARALALREAGRTDTPVAREVFRDVLNTFFVQRGMMTPQDIGKWLTDQGLDADSLTALIQREVRIGQIEIMVRQQTLAQLSDALRTTGPRRSHIGDDRTFRSGTSPLAFCRAEAREYPRRSGAPQRHARIAESIQLSDTLGSGISVLKKRRTELKRMSVSRLRGKNE